MPLSASLARASARGLRLFVQPPFRQRRFAWALVLVTVCSINTVDYLLGIDLSLSLFYLVPVSLAAGWLGAGPGAAIALFATAARVTGDIVVAAPASLPSYVWWNTGAAMVIFLFVVWLVDALVSAHRSLEGRIAARTSELADSIADRRRLELELLAVGARERAAFGRELHDELGQHLVATALASQVLAQQLGQGRGGREAHVIVQYIEQAIAKTRKLARGLLLADINSDRLVSELEELAASASHGDIRCRVLEQGGRIHASPAECAQLFRIAQEALGNALRHGHATEVDLTVAVDAQACCLMVVDNGRGFQPAAPRSGMGLRIMEHRAQMIGASLAVLSTPKHGTKVICRLPIKAPSDS